MKNRSLKAKTSKTTKIRDTEGLYHVVEQEDLIKTAIQCVNRRFQRGRTLNSSETVKQFLQLRFQGIEHEVFLVIYLDSQHRIIDVDEAFSGTINSAAVYPREVVKAALLHNAGAVIFAHNHPSGVSEPSQCDQTITQQLKSALAFIDVKVLDHFVVGTDVVSFAERGLL